MGRKRIDCKGARHSGKSQVRLARRMHPKGNARYFQAHAFLPQFAWMEDAMRLAPSEFAARPSNFQKTARRVSHKIPPVDFAGRPARFPVYSPAPGANARKSPHFPDKAP